VSSATRRWDLATPADESNKRSPVIFTVGHGTRPIEEFLAILGAAGIRRLVDVRTAPGSRRHPQFGRDALAASLQAQAIEYAWRKDLGGFRTPRPDSPHVALRNDAFRGYADHMETEEFRSALSWLIDTSRDTSTAIMCAEVLWWRCHRRMISDALTVAGCEVVHLLDEGRREPHRLNPSARIERSRLVYDVGAQQALAP
jgi:uncharacterized protein (DUF488 family)